MTAFLARVATNPTTLYGLVRAVNALALDLRTCGVDAATVETPEKWQLMWRLTSKWEDGRTAVQYFGSLRDLWDGLEERLERLRLKRDEFPPASQSERWTGVGA